MSHNTRKNTEKVVLIASIATCVFLLLIYLNYAVIKSDFVLIGVFQEMLTIPCILIQPVLLVMSIRSLIQGPAGNRLVPLVSAIIVGIAMALVWGSFFIT